MSEQLETFDEALPEPEEYRNPENRGRSDETPAGRPFAAPPEHATTTRRPKAVFLWESFGPHHVDRCKACVTHLGDRYDICGIEIATFDANYQWRGSIGADGFTKLTLFPGVVRQKIGTWRCFRRIVAACLRARAKYIFLCNYDAPAIFLSAIVLRLLGRRVVIMQDSKFDDKQRYLLKEAAKGLLYRPYHAALVAGQRTRSYLAFLGMPEANIFIGYDTVSVARIRQSARAAPAPAGVPHAERHFTVVARFVPKKNLVLALEAYAAYVAHNPGARRELHLCGSGELEPMLRQHAERLRLDGVHFRGYLQEHEIARVLASSLALILPSIEEQHGLVINEAIAMGVPVLASDNCGARDLLVRSGVNGYIFEPDNAAGLAHFMGLLDRDAGEWKRLACGTRRFEPAADTSLFVEAVERVLTHLAR
ncbi:MAG TPA: glycosyltransferase family 4 protein [Stellaceae bacterium]|nr:glycosyltransferase family 4 protein [Stellaceae bacterium]